MPDKLSTYRGKRDQRKTPEPVPEPGPLPRGNDDTFVIQEHHASRLHWDFRLERDGVLVSWAIPKGMPVDPARNHLAVHTEDHPLDYAAFEGEIPKGEYGGGAVTIWDRGSYTAEKWTESEVKVVLQGQRVSGRYVLFRTDGRAGGSGRAARASGPDGRNWMIHRMDPPESGFEPMPELVPPMLATLGTLPPTEDDERWGYEIKWDGVRAVVYVEGGRVRAMTRNDREVSATYPELRGLGEALGSRSCVLDGEVAAFDDEGRTSFRVLQQRMHVTKPTQIRRLVETVPVVYLIFDVLYLDGRSCLDLPYQERRRLLESLELGGASWQTPPYFPGAGAAAVRLSRDRGLEGVVAKRLDSRYEPGRRSHAWVKIKTVRTQEVVIGGWKPGEGRREGGIGSLLLGVPDRDGLHYVGKVGTGFTREMLDDLARRLAPLGRRTSPFAEAVPAAQARDAHWVTPRLVGEVVFAEWTRDGRLRVPSWRGLRSDKDPTEVNREQ